MSVPKKRRTSSSVGRRRSHHALKKAILSICGKCGKAVMQHTACDFCGTYKKLEVIKIKEKAEKKKDQ